jgi:hypothetical protein
MKRHPAWTSGLGLAAAAAVGLAAFVISLPRVNAASIFQELRHLLANHQLSWVSYENLASASPTFPFHMDMEGYIQHVQAGEPPRYCVDARFSSGNMSFNLAGTTLSWDLTGVVAEEFLAQSPQDNWAYFRFVELPDEFWKRNPSAWLLAPVLRLAQAGIYVTGVPGTGPEGRLSMVNMDVLALGNPRTFTNLVNDIEARAGDIQVQRIKRGVYLLEAGDFGGRAGELFAAPLSAAGKDDPFLRELFRQAVFQILYSEDEGVLRVSVLHIGSQDGTINVAFDGHADQFHEDLFVLQHHRGDSGLPVLDFGMIERQFGGGTAPGAP